MCRSHDETRIRSQRSTERCRHLNVVVVEENLAHRLLGFIDFAPRIAILFLALRIGSCVVAELLLVRLLLLHAFLVLEERVVPGDCFVRVLDPEQIVLRFACLLRTLRREVQQQLRATIQVLRLPRVLHVPQIIQLCHREQPARSPRMSADKNQVAFFHPMLRKLQIVFRVRRLAVFIHAEERDIQVVPRIGEVVRIASEKRHVEFRREHQPYVGIFFVLIQVIHRPRIQRHHVAAKPIARTFFLRCRHRLPRSLARIRRTHPRRHHRLNLLRHVLDIRQHQELDPRALWFQLALCGIEPIFHVVLAVR